jgi:hypothetical protein
VNDTEAPVITCPADITVPAAPNQCDSNVVFVTTATDNCPNPVVVCSPASGSAFAVGTTTVTCTATDGSGNTATCSFTITVNDTQPPGLTVNGGTIFVNQTLLNTTFEGTNSLPAGYVATGLWHVTTSCATGSPPNPIRWAYYGQDGPCTFNTGATNSGLLTRSVTIPAGSTSANIRFWFIYNGEGGSPPGGFDNAAFLVNGVQQMDLSGVAQPNGVWTSAVVSLNAFIGQTITLGWNYSTQDGIANDFLGLQIDSILVQAVVPQALPNVCGTNITINNGTCSGVANYTPVATDNCPGATAVCSPPGGSTFTAGVTTVTCTATDASGNTTTCTFTVTVVDNVPPTLCAIPANVNALAEDFEAGSVLPPGWTAGATWHVTTACAAGVPPNPIRWAYFGIDGSCNFNGVNNGTAGSNLTAPSVSIPSNATSASIRFRFIYDGED